MKNFLRKTCMEGCIGSVFSLSCYLPLWVLFHIHYLMEVNGKSIEYDWQTRDRFIEGFLILGLLPFSFAAIKNTSLLEREGEIPLSSEIKP